MTGLYADVPGPRIPYDRDGSVGFDTRGTVTAFTLSQMQALNDEADSLAISENENFLPGRYAGLLFPHPLDLVGHTLSARSSGGMSNLQTSTDSTSGVDGTWTAVSGATYYNGTGYTTGPTYRTAIVALALTGVKGIRVHFDATSADGHHDLDGWHLYGTPSSAPTIGLSLWHPTSDAEVGGAYFDWGDVGQGSTGVRTFRVKNRSATLTATGISVSMEALTPGSPSIVSAHTFSTDGVTYTSSISPSDLAPGAISPVLYIKRSLSVSAALSTWAGRIVAVATAFS